MVIEKEVVASCVDRGNMVSFHGMKGELLVYDTHTPLATAKEDGPSTRHMRTDTHANRIRQVFSDAIRCKPMSLTHRCENGSKSCGRSNRDDAETASEAASSSSSDLICDGMYSVVDRSASASTAAAASSSRNTRGDLGSMR